MSKPKTNVAGLVRGNPNLALNTKVGAALAAAVAKGV